MNPYTRRAVLQRADGKCESCQRPLVKGEYHVHHRTYERAGHEKPSDLEVLCLECHGVRHPHHEFISTEEQKRRARFRRRKKRRDPAQQEKEVRRILRNVARKIDRRGKRRSLADIVKSQKGRKW